MNTTAISVSRLRLLSRSRLTTRPADFVALMKPRVIGALNMWYDADIDAMMTRTARRPKIPRGSISRAEDFEGHPSRVFDDRRIPVPAG